MAALGRNVLSLTKRKPDSPRAAPLIPDPSKAPTRGQFGGGWAGMADFNAAKNTFAGPLATFARSETIRKREEQEAGALLQARMRANAQAKPNTRGGTLLTGASGLSGSAPVVRKSLLGL